MVVRFGQGMLLGLLLVFVQAADAIDFERLFSPGDLIEGHRKWDEQCDQCHVRLREVSVNRLCRDCHEQVDKDIRSEKGFHGKDRKASTAECRSCHTDHKGRKVDIVNLDRDRFNHKLTDYPLVGKHRQAGCSACHKPDKKFREAPGKCIDCHKEDDAHEGKLGKDCKSCHNPKSWTQENFDHDKTDFKLKFAHKEVACDLCHVGNKYKDTPKTCVSCHAIKDVHAGRFGTRCATCHRESKWSETRFRHDRQTRFRLKGRHRQVDCHACHRADRKAIVQRDVTKRRKPRSCVACHKLDDVHKGSNGKRCDQCHNENSWLKASFDHDRKTDFPLRGAHKKASCTACHRGDEPRDETPTECVACHRAQDVHEQKLGKKCAQCHGEQSWTDNLRFDHDLTDFPLIGQHAVAGCETCHASRTFQVEKSGCKDCHAEDDVHERSLGTDCAQCHNPNDWLIWRFDHDEQTEFPLEGAHEGLHCSSCHRKQMPEKPRKRACVACHRKDDIHDGNFGADCAECHTQESFRDLDAEKLRSLSGRAF